MEQWLDHPLFGKDEWREMGENIYTKRKHLGWTQEELAGHLKSDHRVVSRHENGGGIELEMLMRYSMLFECEITDLLPEKYRVKRSLTPKMSECITRAAALPAEKQDKLSNVMQATIDAVA